jgi:putative transposase
LDQNIFETIEEAQEQATNWLWTYNNDRPNMAVGGTTPAMKLKMAAQFYWRTPSKMGD